MELPEERLVNFTASVMKDAENQKKLYLEKVEQRKTNAIEEAKKAFAVDLNNYIVSKIGEEKNIANQQISKRILENRREVLKQRDEIYNNTMKIVFDKINDFIKTAQYRDLMANALKKDIDKIGLEGTIIYINDDEMLEKAFIDILNNSKVKIEKTNDFQIGGFIIKNCLKNIIVDETIDSKIEEQKDYFAQISELSLG